MPASSPPASGRRMRIVRPPPVVWSATIAPPIASTKPRATDSPSPTPPSVLVVQPLERLEEALALRGRDPRAVVDDLDLRAAGAGERVHLDGGVRLPVAQRVVEQVDEDALQQARVGTDRAGGPRARRRSRGRMRPERPATAALTISSSDTGSALTLSTPACRRLASSRFATTASSRSAACSIVSSSSWRSSSRPGDVRLAQRAHRRLDRRQRRAQVVADGRQQRRALPVDVGERARLLGLLGQAPALEGRLRRGGERLQHALVGRRTARARARPAAGRG